MDQLTLKKVLFLCIGGVSFALGVIGLFLPIVPTAPFLILASYCFARSSRRVNLWFRSFRIIRGIIDPWEREGAIPRRAKILSSVMLVGGMGSVGLLGTRFLPDFAVGILLVILVSAVVFIWTRPAPASETKATRRPKGR